MPGDEPGGVVVGDGVLQRAAQLLDGLGSSSMVSKVCTQRKFPLRVRMKRSATALPSGWRTKEGELSMPRKAVSSWKSPDI